MPPSRSMDQGTLDAPLVEPASKPSSPPPVEIGIQVTEPVDAEFLRACAGEFFATLIFLFTCVGMVILLDENNDYDVESGTMTSATRVLIAWTFGMTIFTLVYAFAEVSGGHLNPAVTLCLALGKRISLLRCACYMVAQLLGGTLGVWLFKEVSPSVYLSTGMGVNAVSDDWEAPRVLIGEAIATMTLCLVVLFATNTTTKAANMHIDGVLPLAIGMAVGIGNALLVPIDGCSINPARSFAPALVAGVWEDQWVFWVGPFLGSVLAISLFEFVLKPTPKA